MTNLGLLVQLLFLLIVANGAPIIATKVLDGRFAQPLDRGLRLPDGRPLFGASKTIRGIIVSIASTAGVAMMLGFAWITGATLAATSMTGDLAASFIKRRLGIEVHGRAFGLDQVPEALAPLIVLQTKLDLGAIDILGVVLSFLVAESVLSYFLFEMRIRDRPY